jgi:hypothetical protein
MAAAKSGRGKGKTRTIKPKPGSGQQPISFKSGGLHKSLGVPEGKPIPAAKMQAALSGKAGLAAQKQARFAKNVLGVKTGTGSGRSAAARTGASRAGKGATRGR